MSYEEELEELQRRRAADRAQESVGVGGLFDLVRSTDPQTSHEAASGLLPALSELQARVMAAYREHGAMTAKEAEALPVFADLGFSTVRKRICELHKAGWLRDTGVKEQGCTVFAPLTPPIHGQP